MDVLKWLTVFFVMLLGRIVSILVSASAQEAFKSESWLARNAATYACYAPWGAIKFHIYLALVTTFFPSTYDFVLIKLMWYIRDSSWITEWQYAGALALALFFLAGSLIVPRSNVYAGTVNIVFQALLTIWLLSCIGILTGHYVVLWYYGMIVGPWYEMLLGGGTLAKIAWTMAVITFPLWMITIGVATALCFLVPYYAMRVLVVVGHVLGPAVAPWRYARMQKAMLFKEIVPRERATPPEGDAYSIIAVSDTHVPQRGKAVIHSSRDSALSMGGLSSILERKSLLIHAGDITDTGDRAEWDVFISGVSSARWSVAIPGNHDVNFHCLRSEFWTGLFGDAQKDLAWLKGLCRMMNQEELEFPYVVRSGNVPILFVALNSNCRTSTLPITNALGYVGSKQLAVARGLISRNRRPEDCVVIVLHHHVLLPTYSLAAGFIRCLDAGEVLKFAQSVNAAAIIHGHKHMPYVGVVDSGRENVPLYVVSCGSAHHDPSGPFADVVGGPSCYRIIVRNCIVEEIRLLNVPVALEPNEAVA